MDLSGQHWPDVAGLADLEGVQPLRVYAAPHPALVGHLALISAAMFFFFVDFQRMWDLGSQDFFKSLIYTVFYSVGTVPIQLGVSLAAGLHPLPGYQGTGGFPLALLYALHRPLGRHGGCV